MENPISILRLPLPFSNIKSQYQVLIHVLIFRFRTEYSVRNDNSMFWFFRIFSVFDTAKNPKQCILLHLVIPSANWRWNLLAGQKSFRPNSPKSPIMKVQKCRQNRHKSLVTRQLQKTVYTF